MTARTRRLPTTAHTRPRVSQPSAPAGGPRHPAWIGASYSIQPSSFRAQPAFQILVMWLILPS